MEFGVSAAVLVLALVTVGAHGEEPSVKIAVLTAMRSLYADIGIE